jgi:transposase
MFEINDDTKGGYRRVELLTGPVRRRRWSADEKSRIVEETLVPGARVSEVARRWRVCPQQVFGWRRAMRHDEMDASSRPGESLTAGFVPIVTDKPAVAAAAHAASAIEVRLAGAVIRVGSGLADDAQLIAVLRAVRASASRA